MGRGLRLKNKAEVEAMLGRDKKPSKYKNEKVTIDNITFDSKREAHRYGELKSLRRAGEIDALRIQPRYYIEIGGVEVRYASGRQVTYIADFEYRDRNTGLTMIEDVKGHRTRVYQIKKALMLAMGLTITEV